MLKTYRVTLVKRTEAYHDMFVEAESESDAIQKVAHENDYNSIRALEFDELDWDWDVCDAEEVDSEEVTNG